MDAGSPVVLLGAFHSWPLIFRAVLLVWPYSIKSLGAATLASRSASRCSQSAVSRQRGPKSKMARAALKRALGGMEGSCKTTSVLTDPAPAAVSKAPVD